MRCSRKGSRILQTFDTEQTLYWFCQCFLEASLHKIAFICSDGAEFTSKTGILMTIAT